MARLTLLAVIVVVSAAPAGADPLLRFGMTFGVDRNAPEAHEVGPLVGVGASAGVLSGEASYTYLSFFGHGQRIHRGGVALRADVYRHRNWGLYGELGAAKKWGAWLVNDELGAYATEQNEVHAGFGYKLADKRAAWQVGLRFGIARRDPMLTTACRGMGCPLMPASSGVAESVMLEWTWLLTR